MIEQANLGLVLNLSILLLCYLQDKLLDLKTIVDTLRHLLTQRRSSTTPFTLAFISGRNAIWSE
jgi:hypothetical protein